MRTNLYRSFIETIVKMQRNQQILNENGKPSVALLIENTQNPELSETKIEYNVAKKKWIVDSVTHNLINSEWDPSMSEIKDFVDYFQDFEVLISIQNYEDKIEKYFNSIPAISLVPKFTDIMRIMATEQNNKEPLPSIVFSNNEIYYDFKSNEYFITSSGEGKNLDFPDVGDFLKDKNYLEVVEALNDTWKNLVR